LKNRAACHESERKRVLRCTPINKKMEVHLELTKVVSEQAKYLRSRHIGGFFCYTEKGLEFAAIAA
jgi:hypothetical protein